MASEVKSLARHAARGAEEISGVIQDIPRSDGAFIETFRLVAVMTVHAHHSFGYSAAVAATDLEVSL